MDEMSGKVKNNLGSGEMGQGLRALSAFADDPG